MGYVTEYSLVVLTMRGKAISSEISEDLIALLRSESEWAADALEPSGETSEAVKWYTHEEDLRTFSRAHPDFLFVLHGVGEGRGGPEPDIWNKYLIGGRMQAEKAKLQINPFDPTKLV